MEEVLYHPELGYYASQRNPIGKQGDFYTSSDVDPLFGHLLARQFSEFAKDAEDFTIVELGAGKGVLAKHILSAQPFPYRIVERSEAMRTRQRKELAGFDVEWIDELPESFRGCIFSNEFFDALPVHRVVRRNGVLREIYINEDFTEREGDLSVPMELPITEGQLADINLEARDWMRRIGASLRNGYHLAIDYGYAHREFYARPRGTLMCYYRHQISEDPYIRIGEQDITAHVNFSDLIDAGAAASLELVSLSTQFQFLTGLGILDEIERLAHAGTAASISRLQSLKKLILPGSMGERFKVLIQRKLVH